MGQKQERKTVPGVGRRFWMSFTDPTSPAFRLVTLINYFPDYISFRVKLMRSTYGQIIPNGGFYNRKFVAPYLASFFSPRQRLTIQSHLCDALERAFSPSAIRRLEAGWKLWSCRDEGHEQSVSLSFAKRTVLEGDLTLEHSLDGQVLHRLTFAFVPGDLLKISSQQILFIGGSQGLRHATERMRTAARQNGEISPVTMTLIAARAICTVMGIEHLYGVRAAYQSVVYCNGSAAERSYDRVWQAHGGQEQETCFVLSVEDSESIDKPVCGKNRSRTRRKRRLKNEILDQIRLNLMELKSDTEVLREPSLMSIRQAEPEHLRHGNIIVGTGETEPIHVKTLFRSLKRKIGPHIAAGIAPNYSRIDLLAEEEG